MNSLFYLQNENNSLLNNSTNTDLDIGGEMRAAVTNLSLLDKNYQMNTRNPSFGNLSGLMEDYRQDQFLVGYPDANRY